MQKVIFIFILIIQASVADCQTDVNDSLTKNNSNYLQPMIVGHRGGFDANLPENSITMFDFTYENACRKPIAIEFDIRESVSGSLYIMHDLTVDRTTNGTGKISELTDIYINTLFLKDRKGNLTTGRVPLFSEVLQHFKDKNCMLMLDVKGQIYPKVIRMVEKMKMESKCILLTFNQNNTKLVKETIGKILISALVQNNTDWETLLKLQIPNQQLIIYISEETPSELINKIYQSKVQLMADVSESIRNDSKHYDPEYYLSYSAKMKLGIMITDYPVYVNEFFCNYRE